MVPLSVRKQHICPIDKNQRPLDFGQISTESC